MLASTADAARAVWTRRSGTATASQNAPRVRGPTTNSPSVATPREPMALKPSPTSSPRPNGSAGRDLCAPDGPRDRRPSAVRRRACTCSSRGRQSGGSSSARPTRRPGPSPPEQWPATVASDRTAVRDDKDTLRLDCTSAAPATPAQVSRSEPLPQPAYGRRSGTADHGDQETRDAEPGPK